MKIYVNFDINAICTNTLAKELKDFGLEFRMTRLGEVDILGGLSTEKQEELEETLQQAGIYIVNDNQFKLVHRIKETISQMLMDEASNAYKMSTYLSEKLNYSYNHLSQVFSQTTLGSIENFMILKKIDVAKTLIIEGKLTFSEIAHQLNYSSSAHLSTQFKRMTGLTPTNFQQLIQQRKERRHTNLQAIQ